MLGVFVQGCEYHSVRKVRELHDLTAIQRDNHFRRICSTGLSRVRRRRPNGEDQSVGDGCRSSITGGLRRLRVRAGDQVDPIAGMDELRTGSAVGKSYRHRDLTRFQAGCCLTSRC